MTTLLAGLALVISLGALISTRARHARLKKRLVRLERSILDAERTALSFARARAARESGVPEIEFRADAGEDVFLWELFDRQTAGRFVEVGAFDGLNHSVTFALERLGWTGLLVEPQPATAERCRVNRPASRVVQCAVSSPGSPDQVTLTIPREPREAEEATPGLGTPADDGDATTSFIGSDPAHQRLVRSHLDGARTVQVPQTTMDALIEAWSPGGPIDVAVIDVEGHERPLLEGFDLTRWGVRVVLIESLDEAGDPGVHAACLAAGMTLAGRVDRNELWVRDETMLRRARMLRARL